MKKAIFLLVLTLSTLSTFAKNLEPINVLRIQLNINDEPETLLEFTFETSEELFEFEIEDQINQIIGSENLDEICTASITVTVRVGVDSTFAEASITVEGVSCNAIASEIKRLKAQLKAALK